MERYFDPILSEEQLAAYLDGMMSVEESAMVEDIIAADPELQELQETIDCVDTAYIAGQGEDIPIECMADDFCLPELDFSTDSELATHYNPLYGGESHEWIPQDECDYEEPDCELQGGDGEHDEMEDIQGSFDGDFF